MFCIISLGLTAQVPSYVPTNGLVGWWPFNGNANDESGNVNVNVNNGTVNGATLTTDRFGLANKAYSFDGSNQVSNYITLNNPLSNLTTFTFSYWIKRSTNIGAKWHIMILGSNANHELLFNYDTLIYRNFYNGNLNDIKGVFSNNQDYNHVCVTSNGIETKLYVNGNQIGSGNQTIISTLNGTMHIGKHSTFQVSSATSFNGKLDDIAIYNRALTQQEITNLYSGSTPPTITTSAAPTLINCGESTTLTASSTSAAQPCLKADLPATLQNGLVGYWPFCGNANDASGNNNNGTVNGATLTSDRFGNANSAYSFDGLNDNISLNNSILGQSNSSYSIDLWIQIEAYPTSTNFELINNRNGNSCSYNYRLYINSLGKLFFQKFSESPWSVESIISNSSLLLSSWNHIVLIYNTNNNTMSIYLNNNFQGTINSSIWNSLLNPTNIGFLGGCNLPNDNFYLGKIDDISIYNRALTATEIQQLYTLGNVNYSWSPGNATTSSITVLPTQTTTYTCTASNTAGSTTSSVTVTVADTLTWLGQFDTDWHKPCNWSPQFVPQCCNNVVVPFKSNQPIVSGVSAAEDVLIHTSSGALVSVNSGANLQIGQCPITTTQTACPSLAVVTTSSVSSITQTTAISGGTISYQGASAISARGICWSTSANPTLANSFTTNGTGVGTFTANLTGLIAGTTYYVRAFATNASGTSYGNEVSFSSQTLAAQYPAGSVFCAGPTAIVDVTNPTTGKTWMDRNLGASQAATSATDAAAYGDLYQWGRGNDGHQCRTSATTTTLSSSDQPGHGNFILIGVAPNDWRSPQNGNLWQGINGVNNPCPVGYRVPTSTELNAERASWSTDNAMGAFGSVLKFTRSGRRVPNSGVIGLAGNYGFMWSSTVSGVSSIRLNYSSFPSELVAPDGRAGGESVRCIKN